MNEPDSTSPDDRDGSVTPSQPGATPNRGHHEHVSTDGEVRVDDELGSGDNAHCPSRVRAAIVTSPRMVTRVAA